MEILNPLIEKYAEEHTSSENDLLYKIGRETHLEVMQPRMLSGHLQGRFLSLMSQMKRPKCILEIGTYTGYSALCLAEGLPEDGRLLTLDVNEELADKVRGYFKESKWGNQLEMRIGNALDLIPEMDEKFDMVFIDADKENYTKYFDLIIDKMNPGGIIMADNVLWSGKVVKELNEKDRSTNELLTYNKKIQDDPRVENILMPIRDGILIASVL